MNWYTGAAIYLIVWWLVLFTLLPLGRARADDALIDDDVRKGHDAGAPRKPYLMIKYAGATIVSAIVFALFYWALASGLINLRSD